MKIMTNLEHLHNLDVILDLSRLYSVLSNMETKNTKKCANETMHENGIHISPGNRKIGKCWNFSVAPLHSCTPEACATCGCEGCYANSSYRQYPDTRVAWDENLWWVRNALDRWVKLIMKWFSIIKPDKFRIHVAGDFDSIPYGMAWKQIMISNPDCQFFAFSKQWAVIRECRFYEVPNFKLRLSAWTGVTIPEDLMEHYDIAWVDDGIETRIPESAHECCGNCDDCNYFCVHEDGDTFFHKHGSDAKKGTAKTKKRIAKAT